MDELVILGIVENLRKGSYRYLARKAGQGLVPQGAAFNQASLHDIPLCDQDTETVMPDAIPEFKRRIMEPGVTQIQLYELRLIAPHGRTPKTLDATRLMWVYSEPNPCLSG
ncbi:MAG TPA: hypothetical protein VIN38_05570 [Thiobacillus sp.]